eukprot:Lankesteria_metandrocarpae@DN7246_c0_g1_i1.p1
MSSHHSTAYGTSRAHQGLGHTSDGLPIYVNVFNSKRNRPTTPRIVTKPRIASTPRNPVSASTPRHSAWSNSLEAQIIDVGTTVSKFVKNISAMATPRNPPAESAPTIKLYRPKSSSLPPFPRTPNPTRHCVCARRQRIEPIDELSCSSCSSPLLRCMECDLMLPSCAHCSALCEQTNIFCTAMASQLDCSAKPPPMTGLTVTRQKADVQSTRGESDGRFSNVRTIPAHLGALAAQYIPGLGKDPPPRMLHRRYDTCWAPEQRHVKPQCWLAKAMKPPTYTAPRRTGLLGVIDDTVAGTLNTIGDGMQAAADISEAVRGPTPVGASHTLPTPRYYAGDPPTQTTGFALMDGFNQVMDRALTPRKLADLNVEPEPTAQVTEETGVLFVDSLNRALDNMFDDPKPSTTAPGSATARNSSLIAAELLPCLNSRPPHIPSEPSFTEVLFPCFTHRQAVRHTPSFGEQVCPACVGREGYCCSLCKRNRFTRPLFGATKSIHTAPDIDFTLHAI